MTLRQWSDSNMESIIRAHESDVVSVCTHYCPEGDAARVALWNLSDYAVASVCGPIVYLWPRR